MGSKKIIYKYVLSRILSFSFGSEFILCISYFVSLEWHYEQEDRSQQF